MCLFVDVDHVSDHTLNMSLAACVAKARRACKLKHIIGFAPVIYGVPVYNNHIGRKSSILIEPMMNAHPL